MLKQTKTEKGLITRRRLIVLAAGVPLLAAAWWLGSPLFLDRVTNEDFPYAENATVPDSMTRQEVENVMATIADREQMVDESMAMDVTPTIVKSGTFRDADSFHKGSGTASIYRLPDGRTVLRLEDFRVTNGPDLRVLLTSHDDPKGRDDLESSSYTELAPLKGNIGNQNYEIPASIDIAQQQSVVIYCRPFHVVFSVAMLDG